MKTMTLAAIAASLVASSVQAQEKVQTAETKSDQSGILIQPLSNGGRLVATSNTTLVFDKAGTVTCMKTIDQNGAVTLREMTGTKCPSFVTSPALLVANR